MAKHTDVLDWIRQHVDSDAFEETVERLVRVPEVWKALDEIVPDQVPGPESGGKSLSPSQIVFGSIFEPSIIPNAADLPADLRTELERTLANSATDPAVVADQSQRALALRALALLELEDHPGAISGHVKSSPDMWRAPLACAWPYLADSGSVLSDLLADGDLISVQVAVACVLSHSTADEAAAQLMNAYSPAPYRLLGHLHDLGEQRLAEAVARQILSADEPSRSHKNDPVEALIDQASAQERVNGPTAAQNLLDAAWERAGQIRADIADRLADVADGSGETVVAAEALRRAVEESPTPDRKSRAALALIDANRIDEGLGLLPASPETPTELIAVGLAYAKDGRKSEAAGYLKSASEAGDSRHDLHPRWMARLTQALLDCSCPSEATQVAERWVDAAPGSLSALSSLAHARQAAGNHEAAADAAELLLARDASDDHARQILAESLQAQGRPERALEHWQQLALSNARMLKHVVECALDAGHLDLAKDQASRWLALDPDSPQALVHYGRALTASGDFDAAKEHLTLATERAPQSPETWMALADAQRATGNDGEADDTLSRAIQICPDQPSLLTAKGRALARQEQYSEALELFEQALRQSEDDPDIQLGYGELLTKLGHLDRALPILQGALSHRPAHVPSRIALAGALEQIGDVVAAHDLILDLPDGASDQAQVLAGRLGIKASKKTGERQFAERGLHRLRLAGEAGEDDREAAFWVAEGLRLSGRSEEAMAAYQSCLNDDENATTGDLRLRASHGLAQAAMEAGQTPVAISVLETLRQSTGGSPESLILLSRAYRMAGLPDEALAPAMEAVEKAPDSVEARSESVKSAIEAEAWGAALAQIERWAAAAPGDAEAWLQKARLHTKMDQTDDARSALARALMLGRSQPKAVVPIAHLLTQLDKSQQAVRLLKRASNLDPSDTGLLKTLAETAERAEAHEGALEAWSTLADRSPDDQTALRHVGESLWRLHRRSAAIGHWQRGLVQDPKNVGLAIRLAQAHMENGEPQRGLENFRQALALCPDDPRLATEAASAFRDHGFPDEALEALQTASALVPGDDEIKLAIADTHTESGSHEAARQTLVDIASRHSEAPVSVLARLSLTELALGNAAASQDALASINSGTLETAKDAVMSALAAVNHADWSLAAMAADTAIELAEDDPISLVAAIELRAQLSDAAWLFGEAADARVHAPDTEDVTPDAAQAWITKARRMGVDEKTCERLDTHLALAGGRLDPNAVDGADESPRLMESLVVAHLRAGETERALSIYANSPEARQSQWAPVLAGLAHLGNGRYVQARKAFGAAPNIPCMKPLAAYFTARALLQQGQTPDAIDALNSALAAWPDVASWHHTLAHAYAGSGEMDMALPHYQQAAELDSTNGSFALSLAKHLQALGMHHQAEESFAQVMHQFPDDADVWRQAGYAAMAIGDTVEASQRFRRASDLAPDDSAARIGAARAAQAGGQLSTALQWATQAVNLAPENSDALMGWADVLAAQGKLDKALTAYQRAEANMADPTQAQIARSQLFLKTGRPEAAVLELNKVVETRPDDENAWSSLASAYESSGDLKQATAAVKKALGIAPADSRHRLSLARLSRKSGQLDHALSELSTLQLEEPDNADVAYELGRVHEARRDFDKAMDGYHRAIALDRDHAPAHYHAGLVLKNLKDYDQAAEMFKCAVDLSPNDADAHHQLAAVRALELVHGGIQTTPAVAQ
jgi:tetratricopeptide (TPR) repeat protein